MVSCVYISILGDISTSLYSTVILVGTQAWTVLMY